MAAIVSHDSTEFRQFAKAESRFKQLSSENLNMYQSHMVSISFHQY